MSVLSILDKFFQSAFVSNDGISGSILCTDVRSEGDGTTLIRGLIGHGTTPDATPLSIVLSDFGSVAANDVLGVEAYVTCKKADGSVRRKIKISCVVYGNGATATLDAAPDVDAKGTGAATATIVVTGSTFALQLTGIAATTLTWGWELRRQKL